MFKDRRRAGVIDFIGLKRDCADPSPFADHYTTAARNTGVCARDIPPLFCTANEKSSILSCLLPHPFWCRNRITRVDGLK